MSDQNSEEPVLGNPGPELCDGDPSHTELREEMLERALAYLGFSSRPEPTVETLNEIAKQWSAKMGYDNICKRIHIGEQRTGAFPIMDPNDFFESAILHGTGGGCWPSGEAAFGLLLSLGFKVDRVAGTMLIVGDPLYPAHGAINIEIEGRTYRMEPSLGAEAALELIDGVRTSHENEAFGLWQDGDCNVWWRPGHSRTAIETTIKLYGLSSAFFYYRNEATKRHSVFNNSIYIRRNRNKGSLTYARGKLIEISEAGNMSAVEVDPKDVGPLLIESFGLSEHIVDQLPADREGVSFDA